MVNDYKEVYFDQYCKTCKNEKTPENKEPCYECLNNPVNLNSRKPVNWEEKQLIYERRKTMVNLTDDEKNTILEIAKKVGCDIDGDLLQFYVKIDEGVVQSTI